METVLSEDYMLRPHPRQVYALTTAHEGVAIMTTTFEEAIFIMSHHSPKYFHLKNCNLRTPKKAVSNDEYRLSPQPRQASIFYTAHNQYLSFIYQKK